LLGPNVTNNKLFEKDILNAMANDNISFVSRRDEIIVRFGEKLYLKTGNQKHQYKYVKQKIRELGHFLIAARKYSSAIHNIQD